MRILAVIGLLVAALFSMAPAHAGDITVYSSGTIAIGEFRQLTAYVPLSPNTVTWTVNGIPGGNSTIGTISATGLFQAPAAVPMANAITVTATTTSIDQYGATMANWFGVTPAAMTRVFPNLGNFPVSDIGFLG